jgi:hypothetical protein
MAINPVGFMNFMGPQLTNAEAGQAVAQTGLTQQQAQSAAMQNQIQRASMPLIMNALNQATADQSGSNPGSTTAGGAGGPAARQDQSGVLYNQDSLEDTLRNQNYVTPYTPQEMKMLQASKTLSIADPARGKAMFDQMNAQRQARIDMQTSQNQNAMGNTYDAATAVATRDPDGKTPGATFSALEATDPQDAAAIRAQATTDGQFDPAYADQLAGKYANHLAAVSHLYSGRGTKIENGQLIDEKTGQAVTGQTQTFTGLTGEQMQKEHDFWAGEMKYTTPDGVEHTQARWQAPVAYGGLGGKMTPAQAALAADQAARRKPGAGVAAPAQGGAAPPDNTGQAALAAASTHPLAAPANGASANTRLANRKGALTNPAPTGADIAAGTAGATAKDDGSLPGVDPRSFTRAPNPTAGQGPGGPSITGKAMQEAQAKRTNDLIDQTTESSRDAATMHSQIAQARAEVANIDPRTVGPGSGLYNTALKFYTAAAGTAPNALIDEGALDKFLNQIGASNVRQLLQGQRITNQEMMTFLTRGSPSTSMPLGGIAHLLNYLDADNEYTMRANRTKQAALAAGANPATVSDEIEQRMPRAAFVAAKTKSNDTISNKAGVNTGTQPDITQEAHAKLNQGDPFYWQGKLHHKGVD